MILYLKINMANKSFYQIFVSSFNLSSLFMRFLMKSNGIITIQRILEDSASANVLKKGYESTKKSLKMMEGKAEHET